MNKKMIGGIALCVLLGVGCSGQKHMLGSIENLDDGIVGGKLIMEEARSSKWVVALQTESEESVNGVMYTNVKGCTGAMITDDIVLTAAHCIHTKGKLSVVFSPMAESTQAVRRNIKKSLLHSGFKASKNIDWKKMDEDIALLKLDGKKPKEYEILNLTTDFPRLKSSFPFLAIGYGFNDAQVLGFAHAVQSKGVSFEPNLNYFIADQRNSKGICPGDSGGPAIVTKDNRNYVIGVAQAVFSYKGSLENAPGPEKCKQHAIYTNVQYYRPWILEGIKKLNR